MTDTTNTSSVSPNSSASPHPISSPLYAAVAIPVPMRQLFDYELPETLLAGRAPEMLTGCRVQVSFNFQQLIGVIISCHRTPSYDPKKIKPISDIIDNESLVTPELLSLCQWASRYYHHPIGETLFTALPKTFRQGKSNSEKLLAWTLSHEGKGLPATALKRAKKQQQVLQYLQQSEFLTRDQLSELEISPATIKNLLEKELIEQIEVDQPLALETKADAAVLLKQQPPTLTSEQQTAVDQIRYHQFATYLLEGTTGSGKTEVYLQLIARVLQSGRQALVLIPEIGLTPQTIQRFQQRFNCRIAELHSGVSEGKRRQNWLDAKDGRAQIIIGTRLASFTPIARLGIVIIDEEHDLSYKQQDSLRYSARDLSIYRACTLGIPVVLGSATPSLESLHNALQGRYQHLELTHRAGNAKPPTVRVVDIRQQSLNAGLCNESMQALTATLDQGHQAMVFINRRGYAPTLLCHSCGWSAECRNCDTHMTLHQQPRHLHCHHCDRQQPVPRQCPQCASTQLTTKGQGTEQTEEWLQQQYPGTPVLRVDRDSTRLQNSLAQTLSMVASGEPCILIGTQMLAKGHHLPNIALVIVVDCDQGLLSADFRGPERMGQLIVQVSGRAGRENIPGNVLIQTHTPDHPLLECLLQQGYHQFARHLLNERQATALPPFYSSVLFRAESKRAENAIEFLHMVAKAFSNLARPSPQLHYLGPIPAQMERINERYRFQFQLKAASRKFLQGLLKEALEVIDQHALAKRTRWSVDVDPLEN